MQGEDGVYIRSMASRGALGGVAREVGDVCDVMEASGRSTLLIETVGVGQDEVEVTRLVDVTVLVLVPGMGDDVQSLKAGLMEVADIYAINKSDRGGAEQVEAEILAMQGLAVAGEEWTAPVVRCRRPGSIPCERISTARQRRTGATRNSHKNPRLG